MHCCCWCTLRCSEAAVKRGWAAVCLGFCMGILKPISPRQCVDKRGSLIFLSSWLPQDWMLVWLTSLSLSPWPPNAGFDLRGRRRVEEGVVPLRVLAPQRPRLEGRALRRRARMRCVSSLATRRHFRTEPQAGGFEQKVGGAGARNTPLWLPWHFLFPAEERGARCISRRGALCSSCTPTQGPRPPSKLSAVNDSAAQSVYGGRAAGAGRRREGSLDVGLERELESGEISNKHRHQPTNASLAKLA